MSVNSGILQTFLSDYDIILGSSSPRRYEIVHENLGIQNLEVLKPDFEENLDKSNYINHPIEYVRDTSKFKAEGILEMLKRKYSNNSDNSKKDNNKIKIAICADTVVIDKENKIYEKPSTAQEQLTNLQKFCYSNEIVTVVTAINLIKFDPKSLGHQILSFDDKTYLHFDNTVPIELIKHYVSTGEGSSAAGGFKIQDASGSFIKKIDGDFYNVVGLPLNKTVMNLCKLAN